MNEEPEHTNTAEVVTEQDKGRCAPAPGSGLDQTHWPCACVKRDRAGRLKAIKLHPNSVQRCPVCGAKQCTLLKAPNTEVSSGAKTP